MFLHEKIKRIREDKGISRKELGRLTKSSSAHIRHIEEKQSQQISLKSFCEIAKVLGVTREELIKDTEFDIWKNILEFFRKLV